MSPIPVVILSGFLGAGKSTLINDLLAAPEMKDTAIVVESAHLRAWICANWSAETRKGFGKRRG